MPSLHHRSDFLRCHPHTSNVRAGEMSQAGGHSLKKAELHRRVSSPGVNSEVCEVSTSSSAKWACTRVGPEGAQGRLSGPACVPSSTELCPMTQARCICDRSCTGMCLYEVCAQ